MIKRRSIRCALAGTAVAISATAATPAVAQRVDRIVAFGDSYADTGNAFALLGIDPLTTVIYPTGRFTGGTNYVDTLGQTYSVAPQDFAIGGARTASVPGQPGLDFEVATFLAGGGGVFPTVTPSFSTGDLVTVSIGGNDARAYQQGGGTVAGVPAAATQSVAQATAGMNALVNAGAPTISWLAGNTALLPEVAGDANAQTVRAAYSSAFNQGMQTTLAGYAANGVIVHYLDLTAMLQQVQADPAAYGFTNLGPCAPIAQCVTDANYASQYVFWVDGLHPTSHTSAVIAQYIATQLQGPLTLGAPSELGLDMARQFGRSLTGRMDLSSPRDGGAAKGLQVFVTGDYLSRDVSPDSATDAFEIRGYGVTAGAQYGFGNGVVGIAGNYSRPKASFTNDASETRDRTWQIGGFAAVDLLGGFGEGYVGYGHDNHRITRSGVVTPMTASPSGSHWIAGAKAGYLASLGLLRIGPVVALDYAKAKVDAYTESGDSALTLNVGSSSAKTLEGSVGAELRGKVDAGAAGIRPFGSVVVVKDLAGDGRAITFSQTSAPGIVNSWQLADRSKHIYERVTAGASARLTGGVNVEALVSTTFSKRGGNETSAHAGLRLDF
jgi:phospholipase/lecithinase/hemolysin/uncharacterized protein YhjY with autotransporter beta-barrel domain